jgi:hypothetical protein
MRSIMYLARLRSLQLRLNASNRDMGLATPCVHCDDDIALRALVEHFLLIRAEFDLLALAAPL